MCPHDLLVLARTEESTSDIFTKQTLLIRTRIPTIRRLEYVLTNGKVGWKEARKLVINNELISTGGLFLPADEDAPMADFSLGVDANLTTYPFQPKAPWTKHYSGIEKKNEL